LVSHNQSCMEQYSSNDEEEVEGISMSKRAKNLTALGFRIILVQTNHSSWDIASFSPDINPQFVT